MEQKKHQIQQVTYQSFKDEYFQNLEKPSCLLPYVEELCGGWTLETLKQNIFTVTKKNAVPLPLLFGNYKEMEWLSTKKEQLEKIFKLLDTRGLGRIDACELYAVLLFIVEGDLDETIRNQLEIPIIFGFKQSSQLNKDEFFLFLDSLFKGLSKILIVKGQKKPQNVNKRLTPDQLKEITDVVYNQHTEFLEVEQLQPQIEKHQDFYEFIRYIHQTLQTNMELAREKQIQDIKITIECKKVLNGIVQQIEKSGIKSKK